MKEISLLAGRHPQCNEESLKIQCYSMEIPRYARDDNLSRNELQPFYSALTLNATSTLP